MKTITNAQAWREDVKDRIARRNGKQPAAGEYHVEVQIRLESGVLTTKRRVFLNKAAVALFVKVALRQDLTPEKLSVMLDETPVYIFHKGLTSLNCLEVCA